MDTQLLPVVHLYQADEPKLLDGSISTFLNPYSYILARQNARMFGDFDRVFFDGAAAMALAKMLQVSTGERVSFDMTSLAPVVLRDCCERQRSIYFLGAKPGEADVAVTSFKAMYPDLKVSGVRHGYFSSVEERTAVLDEITKLSPDVVVVGLGTPLQEEFLLDLRKVGWKGTGYTCGGFLHQTATKGTQYYPKWMDRLNLRWLYRMIDEPKLVKRYAFYYPWFVLVFTYDVIRYRLGK